MKVPVSGSVETGGMFYFARMLEKIRLFARAELREDFHRNLGRGADGWCCDFLRIDYDQLKDRTLQGGTNEEVLDWCFEKGRHLNKGDLMIWNAFASKLGWNDRVTARLAELKQQAGLAGREDILTMFEFFEVDEGRKP